MPSSGKNAGYFRSGLPYNRLGHGPRPLVVFQGLIFENKPQSGMTTQMYNFLKKDYEVYAVLRKSGMPRGYTLQDMAGDYASMIREEFGGPIDVVGVSTGGSIALPFAADHPDLVRRLVIHSSAYSLSEEAKKLQLEVGKLAQQRQWRRANSLMIGSVFPSAGIKKYLSKPVIWLASILMSLSTPDDPSDLLVTIQAEDQFNFKDQLAEITVTTLLIAGDQDSFYTPDLFQETAAGIPNARLILYEGVGHPASGKQFQQDVLEFLRAD
jgi:pimeloyl-ACP methyl ester carboxylesterase